MPPSPAELGAPLPASFRTPVPDDYRPKTLRERGASLLDPDQPIEMPPVVDLKRIAAELEEKPLDRIATLVRSLTYGEMMELAEAMWKVKPGDKEVTQADLPVILHAWSTAPKEGTQ